MENRPPYSLSSVDNALRLLQMLRDEGRLRVSECAQELGVARSTAHRLLTMLVYRNFAVQDDSHAYLPGPAMSAAEITGGPSLRQLRHVLLPSMDALCDRVGETINLMIRVGTQVRFLASIESTQALHVGDRQGAILPAHLVSGGKAMLAALSGGELAKLYLVGGSERAHRPDHPLEPTARADGGTAMTAAEFQRLVEELHGVRLNGYALNFELTEPGICAIGMCVKGSSGSPVAALSIAVPTSRLPKDRVAPLVAELRSTAIQAERDLALMAQT